MKKKILIITGDPNSINSEIIYKCWKSLNLNKRKEIFFISNIFSILDVWQKVK